MLILERDRATVEELLRTARARDGRVDDLCRAAGARLDGTDDLLVLCAIDDGLARFLPEGEHPLYRPVSFRPRIGRPRPPTLQRNELPLRGCRPGPESLRIDVDRLLQEFMDPLDELRWPGGGRPGIERIARGLPAWDRHARDHLDACLAAVRVSPAGRVAMQRRARQLATLPREVQLVETLVEAVGRFAESHGAPARAFAPPVSTRLGRGVLEPIARTPDAADEARRRWLLAEAEHLATDPHRLRVRSREASEVVGVAPPWVHCGPASLAEALDAWRRNFGSPLDLERLETEIRQARLLLAASLAEVLDESRAALAATTGAGRRSRPGAAGKDAQEVLVAALAAAVDGGPARGADERPPVERLVAAGGLSPDAVETVIRRLWS